MPELMPVCLTHCKCPEMNMTSVKKRNRAFTKERTLAGQSAQAALTYWSEGEECAETVVDDGMQEGEKLQPVLRVVLKVAGDHLGQYRQFVIDNAQLEVKIAGGMLHTGVACCIQVSEAKEHEGKTADRT